MIESDHSSDPPRFSQGDISLQQSNKGDRNQTIGQVLGGMVVYVSGGQAIFNSGSQGQEPAAKPSASTIGPNPYRGLMAFQETDGDRFFGREKQIGDLWSKLRDLHEAESAIRLLPIYGPSGSGKSSLARAGLIPELARHPIPGCDRARVAILVPGTHPLEALATVLARIATNDPIPVEKSEEFERVLKKVNDAGHYDGLRRIANALPDITISPLIVLVDQFEEIYTLCETQEERDAFVEALLCAAGDRAKRVTVIVTLRSDFLGETQKHPVLNELFAEQGFLVRSMKVDELREAIAKPAELAGYPLDQATVDLLIKETEGREGALPLLQFALTRIWEGLSKGKKPAETLEEIGGVGGALAGEAQRIYDSISPDEQAIARRVFLGLVQLGEGTRDTRRRAAVENLVSHQDDLAQVQRVLNRFTDPGARLITCLARGNRTEAEVTHEALFDHWQELNQWLDQSRDDLRFQRQLEESARHWDQNGRPDGSLWRSPDLDFLVHYHQRRGEDLTPLQLTFFRASQQAETNRNQLRRMGITGLVAGIMLTTSLSVLALAQLQQAERRRAEQLATTAKLIIEAQPLEGSLNAIAAEGLSRFPLVRFPGYSPSSVQEGLLDASQKSREKNSLRHQDRIWNASFSPDGQLILTASDDQTAKLWDLQGNLIATLLGHQDVVWNAKFSSDGQTILTYSPDQTAKLWNLQGNLITTLSGHQGEVSNANFSPDGQLIITASNDRTAKLWDLQGNLITTLLDHEDTVTSARFSPDGQFILTASYDKTAKLWDLQGNLITTLLGHSDVVWDAYFTPDSQSILTTSWDKTAKLWDSQGNLITNFSGHEEVVYGASFSPDGQYILTRSKDSTARLWDLQGNLISILTGHQDTVRSASFNPRDGQSILTASSDQTVKLWDLKGQLITTFYGHKDTVYSASFSSDGQSVITASRDQTAKLWDLQGNLVTTFSAYQDVIDASFSPDGKFILTTQDQTAKLWDLQGNLITTLAGHQDVVSSASFSFDGQSVLTASWDYEAKLWGLQGNLIKTLSSHQDAIYSASFSPDDQSIVTASLDQTAKLWDLQGRLIKTFSGHENAIYKVVFSPDGQSVLTASADTTAKLWDIQGNIMKTLEGDQSAVNIAVFSPDGQNILATSRSGMMKLWDHRGNFITSFTGHQAQINNVSFSPTNGHSFLTASSDRTARLWNLQGKLITIFSGHQDVVFDARFSPDGQFVITASWDGTAKIWDLEGNLIATLFGHKDRVNSARFSPDGKSVLTASRDGTAQLWKVWEINRDSLLQKLCDRLQYHPALTQPQTDVAHEAKRTCERYAWED